MLPSGSLNQADALPVRAAGDAVLGLELGHVVLLEDDAALAQAGEDAVEVVDDEEGDGVLGARGRALVDQEHRAGAGAEGQRAFLLFGLGLQAEGVLVEAAGAGEVGGRQ